MRLGWQVWSALGSALVYALLAFLSWDTRGAGAALLALVPVLGFIWFCEFWSTWLGPLLGGGHHAKSVDQESPAWLIAAFGWLILISVAWLVLFE